MINSVTFENEAGQVLRPYADFGVLLVSYDAPEPKPKTYRVSLEGMNGDIDMSDWAGAVYFNSRTVSMTLRDLGRSGWRAVVNFLLGRRVKITFSDDPEWYFVGRCEDIQSSTRKRVANTTLTFTCDPYRLAQSETTVAATATSTAKTKTLYTSRRRVVPEITVTGTVTLVYDGNTYSLTAGTHKLPTFIIDDTPREVSITGSGTVSIKWRDGVL